MSEDEQNIQTSKDMRDSSDDKDAERGDEQTSDVKDVRRREVRRLRRSEYAYLLALAAFAVLAVFARIYAYFDWDLRAARWLQTLDVPGLDRLMRAASVFGNGWHGWALTTVSVLLFFFFRRRSEAAGLLLSAGGGELVNRLIKIFIARPRPTANLVHIAYAEHSQSFPSGHVTFYVCFFGFLFFVAYALLPRDTFARRLALVLIALPVLLVGLSRVYLGEHWPSDTIGAYLLSGLWLALSLHFYRRWKKRGTFHAHSHRHSD